MNKLQKTAGWIITLSLFSTVLLALRVEAQADAEVFNSDSIPIDDQARFLHGLESRHSSEWNFALEGQPNAGNTYQLQISNPEVKLVEQDIPAWRNSGDDPNYSILVDLSEFSEIE